MLLLITNRQNALKVRYNEEELKDEGTCKNCKHQGDCPYADGTCSRAYYHKIYSNKKEKSVDKFVLKQYNKLIKGKVKELKNV